MKSRSRSDYHAQAPQSAAFVKAMREVFGEDVKVLYVKENGVNLGEPTDPRAVVVERKETA